MQGYHFMSQISGSCSCKKYRFHARADPFWISYCHCADCRKATGAPVTVFVGFKEKDVDLLGSSADTYQSSGTIGRLYCSTCGSPIAYVDARLPNEIYFYLGVMDQQAELVPRLHSWVSEKLPWFDIRDHLPTYKRFSRER